MSEKVAIVPVNLAITSPYTIYQAAFLVAIVSKNPSFLLFVMFGILCDLLNAGIKFMLKKLTSQSDQDGKLIGPEWGIRPDGCGQKIKGECTGCGIYPDFGNFSTTWGFPSGHAQITSFAATFWSIYMYKRYGGDESIVPIVILWLLTFLIWFQRVYSRCHNVMQIIGGFMFGLLYGFIVYYICSKIAPKTFLL
jgi:membrane-associated phospholipid phosphatase